MALTGLAIAGCQKTAPRPLPTEVAALVDSPAEYTGQTVEITGYLSFSSRGGRVFESEEAATKYDLGRAIRAYVPDSFEDAEELDGTYSRLTGRFEAEEALDRPGAIAVETIHSIRRFRPRVRPKKATNMTPAEAIRVLEGQLEQPDTDPRRDHDSSQQQVRAEGRGGE